MEANHPYFVSMQTAYCGMTCRTPFRQLLSDAQATRDKLLAPCARFVVELRLPAASRNLRFPGELEGALVELLRSRIGIGEYPNNGRAVSDMVVAVSLASRASAY
jgi:hypothetical protein